MKLFTSSCMFDYPWEQVSAANWNKYPNEVSTHVKAVDVLRRELRHGGQVLMTERLITVQQSVPRWIMALVGGSNLSYVREVSTVDLRDRSLKMRSCNLTYVNIMKVYETVNYTPHPEAPQGKTLFEQEAKITAYGAFTRLCNSMEDFSFKRFCDNAQKGKRGFDSVLEVFDQEMDTLGLSQLVSRVNETVEDVRSSAENWFQEIERKCTILSDYHDFFSEAFRRE
ncbi:PRELI/slowmo family protein KNAG_0A02720 [Huiozyma naganishii CBS 8797]|uniref:PRELI/MSF1 domain-containing protein n=1 Tax=Huiozyma naganishii (strain ATCC MYA-139 / BCRC 22969 / CBS 8797 / KCTC 17520 / NBRC 10181 / NCYC 3082 / Yp74L-3) TaxID=1071383 RepID=J7S3G4_HUIN7|nr:hypothetical protein KNAG_0A02720 [Kazachstania naganishii CBS 8797]CCK67961.1 hypothetical protein KNAG_0A02720 [Kazachstania naganishii CBS 8797]